MGAVPCVVNHKSVYSANAFAEVLNLLSVDYFTPDDFLSTAGNTVHTPDPFPLRLTLQIFGHTLVLCHSANEVPIAALCLLIEVGKTGMQLACQNQVIEQKWIRFFQIRSVHPPPLSDRTVIVLRQFNGWNVSPARTYSSPLVSS